jgi:hypothetical protein
MNNGLDFNLTREQYDGIRRVNWSSLKLIAKSPAHYRQNQLTPRADTDALKRGRCTHLAVFEPEVFASTCVVWDGGARRGKDWDAFRRKHAASEILTEKEHGQCVAIAAAVRADAAAAKYLAGGKSEATVLWTHTAPDVGHLKGYSLDCKSRIDFVATCGALVDLKTTRDASPDGFGRECWRLGYHAQAAFYSDAFAAATGSRLPYVLVAVEAEAPYAVTVYRVPEVVIEAGREHYRALLDRLWICRSENRWPAYADGELELTLPSWAIDADDEDVSGLDLDFHNNEDANGLGL